ncbi:MAG: hypothetical protein EP329_26910 [Deltaproteobacteria bacterium]|nr:MAG: hypothetical protein EP329_26910 [Deltaproteobacteria bacterium]
MTRLLTAFALVALLAAPAAAYPHGPGGYVEESVAHEVAITISPIHLVLPVFEVQAEIRATEQVSASVILGFGSVKVSDGFTTDSFSVFEIGGQVAYYALGDFDHGLQLGAELLYLGVSAEAGSEFEGVFGRGLSLAPFVGYKVAADFGLTFCAQIGPAIFLVSAQSDTASESDSDVGVMLNLNLGWSF